MPEVASVEFVSRDQALERFKATQAAQGREDLTQYLESNPLYASINVKLTDPSDLDDGDERPRQGPASCATSSTSRRSSNRVLTVTDFVRTAGVAMVTRRRA